MVFVGVVTARSVNLMLPVYSDELVPPRVNLGGTSTFSIDIGRVDVVV